eukprot:TRINITY_DN21073_c0_g1_i1.p1 TRINITY_DN21073_c0_g1~~TRINITY_DN21073_c0_g1_i1.p1  ORF type:complete len:542 (+),score=202.54 TRINITY_DN21073_c0_g1_i1:34-1659(+)
MAEPQRDDTHNTLVVINGVSAEYTGKLYYAAPIQVVQGRKARTVLAGPGKKLLIASERVYEVQQHEVVGGPPVGLSLQGMHVTSVAQGSPAEKGGLRAGCRIEHVDMHPTHTVADFKARIAGKQRVVVGSSQVPKPPAVQPRPAPRRGPSVLMQLCSLGACAVLLGGILLLLMLGATFMDASARQAASDVFASVGLDATGNDGLPAPPDYYRALGLARGCTAQEIRSVEASYAGSLPYKMRLAFDVLSDPRRRKVYDLMGIDPEYHSEFVPQNHPVDERYELRVTMADTFTGADHVFRVMRREVTGTAPMRTCQRCRMQPAELRRVRNGMMVYQQYVRPDCSFECSVTYDKLQDVEVDMPVPIRQGLRDGEEVVLEMEGTHYTDRLPGDIILHVAVEQHPWFVREGNDILVTIEVPLLEALVGVSRQLEHLDGRQLRIAKDGPVAHGEEIVVPREGMAYAGGRGDLRAVITVTLPEEAALTDDKKTQLIELMRGIAGQEHVDDLLPVGARLRRRRRRNRDVSDDEDEDELDDDDDDVTEDE